MTAIEPWQKLSSRSVFGNRWLHVTVDDVRLPDGRTYEYTTIRRPLAGVGVVVMNDRRQLLLEREYRFPVDEVIYQVPGGLADVGEDPDVCIRRELAEETGLIAGAVHFLGAVWNNPAASDGISYIYFCRDVRAGGQVRHDQAEFIDWDWYDLDWVKDRVADGTIKDRVVVSALTYLWLAGEIG